MKDLVQMAGIDVLSMNDDRAQYTYISGKNDIVRIVLTQEPGHMAMIPGYAIEHRNGTVIRGLVGPHHSFTFPRDVCEEQS